MLGEFAQDLVQLPLRLFQLLLIELRFLAQLLVDEPDQILEIVFGEDVLFYPFQNEAFELAFIDKRSAADVFAFLEASVAAVVEVLPRLGPGTGHGGPTLPQCSSPLTKNLLVTVRGWLAAGRRPEGSSWT